MAPQPTDADLRLRSTLAKLAPGTALRDGLERILRGKTGALLILGSDKLVDSISSGGFAINVDFTATGLRELAKMDGALILDADATKIVRAAVQLIPDPSLPTTETGTRHRTADRVSRQTDHPVISVSKSMNIIALYLGGRRFVLEDSAAILSRANQAIATLERYKHRLDEVSSTLSVLEIDNMVTVRDVAVVAQRLEMVRRISDEIAAYTVELGTDGRLVSLQLGELVAGVDTDRMLIVRDYVAGSKKSRKTSQSLIELDGLDSSQIVDLTNVAKALGFEGTPEALEQPVSARGYRLLARIPRLPEAITERVVEHFGSVSKLLAANIDDLQAVEGIGESRARAVREGLSRVADASLTDRFL